MRKRKTNFILEIFILSELYHILLSVNIGIFKTVCKKACPMKRSLSLAVAHKVYVLAMWWYLKTPSPEPQLNRITNKEDNYKGSVVNVKPGLLIVNKKLRIYSSPRHIAKPSVVYSITDFHTNLKYNRLPFPNPALHK